MSSQVVTQSSTQYAMKKRKKPKPRTKTPAPAPAKSNPSKRHRDRLNAELERLSQLIPLPQDVVNKLDKLSILRLSVAYLRNKSYSKHVDVEEKPESKALLSVNRSQPNPPVELSESELALQALDGFIMVVTQDFNVLYITYNVQDCLGFPQSDVMYQSMLDLIHADDRKQFMKQMLINPMEEIVDNPPEEGDPPAIPDYVKHGLSPEMVKEWSGDGLLHRSFICRLRCLHDTSSGFLALHFTGHLALVPGQNRRSENGTLLPPELGLFLLASPLHTPSILEIRTKNYIFRTKHKLDYTPLGIDQKGRIVLGYTEKELRQQSGYQFIHSADMMHCADAHTKLMRKGQSGLTVFRLLHRANRWQWVTASARLVYAKGIPDCIISTHRPITEQEGEEHLKKRSLAFRFDFTGHASLYASVNPIGGGPPPSNSNRSYGSPPEAKPNIPSSGAKRQRMSNGVRQAEIDPATLWGAQSFQTMENYPEGLPIIKSIDSPISAQYNEPPGIVKSEMNAYSSGSDLGYLKADSAVDSTASPNYSTDSYSPNNENNKMGTPNSGNGDSGYSDTDWQFSPAYNRVLESLYEGEAPQTEPPPLHHPPISEFDIPKTGFNSHQAQPAAYNPNAEFSNRQYAQESQQAGMQSRGWAQAQNQQQAIPQQLMRPQMPQQGMVPNGAGVPQMHHTPNQQAYNQQQGYNQQQATSLRQTAEQPHTVQNGNHNQQQFQPQAQQHNIYPQANHQIPQQPRPVQQLQQKQQYPQNQHQQQTSYSSTQSLVDQVQTPNHYNGIQNYHRHTTSVPKENVSILNALEISSTISQTADAQKEREMQEMLSMIGPNNLKENTDQFEISLECQETTIQFDMDRIAAEYQTLNPLGVIQKYVQNNPTDALAIATGNMPETRAGRGNGIHRVPPNTPAMGGQFDQYNSCQYDQATGTQNGQFDTAYMGQQSMNPRNMMGGQNSTLTHPDMQSNPQFRENVPNMGHKGFVFKQIPNQPVNKTVPEMGPGINQQMGPNMGQNVPRMGYTGMAMNFPQQPSLGNQQNVVNIKKEEQNLDFSIEDLLSLELPNI
ncbi:uncharacterized protein LOC120337615 [Styela clava]